LFTACTGKKKEMPEPDFSQFQKIDHTVKFNNETIPMTVFYSRDTDGEYYVMDGLVFDYDGKKHSVGADNLQKTYFDDPAEFGLIEVADYNFDNYMDIAFLTWSGRGTRHTWYEINIYNPKNKKYEYHAELSKMPDVEINNETQTLRSILNSGHAGLLFTDSEFKWEKGQLTLVNRKGTDYDDGKDEFVLTTGTLSNGVWQEQTQNLKEKDLIATLSGTENISPTAVIDLFQYDEAKVHFINYNNWFSSRYDFRIWGWSKDGKVAYSYTEFQDGAGWETIKFYILNFIDDEILWSKILNDDEGTLDYDALYREFMTICKNNRIEFIQAEFKKMPVMHNNKTYNVIEEQNKRDDSDDYGYNTIESYKITVETQGKSKVINEDTFSEPAVFDIFPLGYFISPLENRALIVIGRHIRHWEGTNNDYIFAGCHLDIGFR
jgi:hypothetical protein